MTPEEALELINASEHTTYTLNARYSGGEDQGAFQVIGGDGAPAVLKTSRNPQWISQIQRAQAAGKHLATLNYPAPTYTVVGSTDRGTYWLENEMPGGPAIGAPTAGQITDLLRLIELQKGQLISEVQGQDWCWYLANVVFRGEDGHVRVLMKFSPQTSALVASIEGLVAGLDGKILPKTDLVHGEMGIGQVLFTGQSVSAVLDWDQVGYGDRTIDLVGLWYSLIDAPEPRDLVMKQLLAISDPQAIKICAAAKMLAVVAWHINKVGGDVDAVVAQSSTAIELLRQI
ncbi:MAG: hypothetical protein JWN01_557 [Patescibacteria group bacterium]|nr:hypothetical protein [Patescibacteria group bacterium]